jgi:two-component system, OmpR family, response regulator
MQAVESQAGVPRAGRCRVLIVEDHAVSSHTLRRLVASEGHEVAVAATLQEAEARLEWAGCLVLDLHLPDGNGIDLLRRVRERRLPVRVAVTTGSAGEELLAAVRDLRPDALFIKPFHPPQLFEWLRAA